MTRSPAFQFYASDFAGSATVGASSAEEIGIYVLLLCRDWMEGGFVFDEVRLARSCKVSVRTFRKAWEHLADKFPPREVGGVTRHFNQRLEAEREKQAQFRAVQSAKGVASGASRRRNQTATDNEQRFNRGSTQGEPRTNSPFPSPASAKALSASSRIKGNGNGASRVGSGDLIPIRPHLPAVLVAPAFCPSCGDGEPVENEKGRIVGKRHKAGCTHGEAA